uniref:Uncharacterized protein n=1 Tax=Encephalitozoon cuniculi TaxID=6035 RepID=M1KJQ7_ENCCN|nr:hypothetical protein ECU05_1200 [Encephalitozoon cuniculi]
MYSRHVRKKPWRMNEKSRLNLILKCIAYTKEPKILILINLLEIAWKAACIVHSDKFSFFVVNNETIDTIKGEDSAEFAQEITRALSETRNKLECLERQICGWYIDAHRLAEDELGEEAMMEFYQYVGREFKKMFSQSYHANEPSRDDKNVWGEKLFRTIDACNAKEANQNQKIDKWIRKFKEEFLGSEYVRFISRNKIAYTNYAFEKHKKVIRRILMEGEYKGHLFNFRALPRCSSLILRLIS